MPILHVYCDESGTTERYMLYGGLIALQGNVDAVNGIIKQWRANHKMTGEMKWAKVSQKKLTHYRSFVDLFFANSRKDYLHFNVVVLNQREIDYKKYHRNDKTLGFYKFYQLFLLHKFARHAHDDSYLMRVFLDQRSDMTQSRLDTIRNVMNSNVRLRFDRTAEIVESVESLVSHQCDLMQIADVLMGAVGYHCNDLHKRPNASPARKALAEYIARQAGVQPLGKGTAPRRADFGIWRFKFKPGESDEKGSGASHARSATGSRRRLPET